MANTRKETIDTHPAPAPAPGPEVALEARREEEGKQVGDEGEQPSGRLGLGSPSPSASVSGTDPFSPTRGEGTSLSDREGQGTGDEGPSAPKRRRGSHEKPPMEGKDGHCWSCHKEKVVIACKLCPRSFHFKCLPNNYVFEGQDVPQGGCSSSGGPEPGVGGWVCVECKASMKGEDEAKSSALSRLSEDEFCVLLKFALQTIKQTSEPSFHQPVNTELFPDYKETVIHPMDFLTIDRNVRKKLYKSTEAFLADVKWVLHNCYVYNNHNHPLTVNARYFFKVAKNEMAEIEVCPDCFLNFYIHPKSWFSEVCKKAHALVWARLKGHPFWPAKVVRIDLQKKEADCRFFGAHDRAWVPFDSCFLLSETYLWPKSKGHKSKFDAAMLELKDHISKIDVKFPGQFIYAPNKTPFDPKKVFIAEVDGHQTSSGEQEKEKDQEPQEPVVKEDSELQAKTEDSADEDDEDEKPLVIASPSKPPRVRKSRAKDPVAVSGSKRKSFQEKVEVDHLLKSPVQHQPLTKSRPSPVTTKPKPSELVKSEVESVSASNLPSNSIKANNSQETPREVRRPRMKIGTGLKRPLKNSANNSAQKMPVNSKGPQKPSVSSQPARAATIEDIKHLKDELTNLKKQIENEKETHSEEINDVKQHSEMTLKQMRQEYESEKQKALLELQQSIEEKHRKEVEETKRKQWCAACLKEAIYFCCWNTSYCGYDCQSKHWPNHMNLCQQQQNQQKATAVAAAAPVPPPPAAQSLQGPDV